MRSRESRVKAGVIGLAVLITLVGGISCASTGGESTTLRGRGDITAAELENISADDAMEAISLVRPQWMRGRSEGATIVINGQPSSRDRLATIPVGSILRIAYMSAADATTRFGTGFFGGAIIVTLR